MRTVSGRAQAEMGIKVPAPGSYTGTVDGHHAIFAVTAGPLPGVAAWWLRPTCSGELRMQSDAWDVEEGRFHPNSDGKPVRCTIRAASGRP